MEAGNINLVVSSCYSNWNPPTLTISEKNKNLGNSSALGASRDAKLCIKT